MRIMIEIDLPDGQDIPRAEDIKKLTDPNWLSEWWHISDVLCPKCKSFNYFCI